LRLLEDVPGVFVKAEEEGRIERVSQRSGFAWIEKNKRSIDTKNTSAVKDKNSLLTSLVFLGFCSPLIISGSAATIPICDGDDNENLCNAFA